MRLTLWQMDISIFCEKARWALDYKGLEYERKTLTPGFHSFVLRLRRRGATVPVLDVDGRPACGSAAINAALDEVKPEPRLYPADAALAGEVRELEAYFDELGHDVRRVTMDPILRDGRVMAETVLATRPAAERRLARIVHPISEPMTRRQYGIDETRAATARQRVREACDRIEARVGPSGHLVGEAFSAADLAAASVLAFVLMPPEYPNAPWSFHPFPDEVCALRDELAAHPGGRWVLDTWARHRRP